ncbi:MAG: Fe2+ transport system protein B [Cyclobacteriaceae bacterium]|jgi:Fe2+ transport system protein B
MSTNTVNSPCNDCAFHNVAQLKKLGLDTDNTDYVVALAGNPNTGKSTVFNALTGLRQHTGNWPGKTVVRAEGGYVYGEKRYKIVDLPGTYSLLSTSEDEEVARNFILFGQPDVTVIVVDASRLERNLNLTLQVLEITNKSVLCLNLMDEATRHGIKVDERSLAKELGIPVVATSARTNVGINQLLATIQQVATGEIICQPRKIKQLSPAIDHAVVQLSKQLRVNYPDLNNTRWIAMRLLDGDQRIIQALENNEFGNS